ncbi:hypothetical protein BDR03DRAFT_964843 [Suillus americanus]|nr:hypothetical protein BDR03DRAFT_964843 [Suillus americanus]
MTVRFTNELIRNITMKLGYSNAKLRCRERCPSSNRRKRDMPSATDIGALGRSS